MDITRAQPHEAETLTRIALAAKARWGYPDRWLETWRGALTLTPGYITGHEVYAARDGGLVRGFHGLRYTDGLAHLEHLWVLPSAMGRGIGRALFSHARERAHAAGCEFMELEADPNAAGFYEKMGGARVGVNVSHIEQIRRELPVFRCRTTTEPRPV